EAKKQNPAIQIIAQMAWAKWLLPLVKDQTEANAKSRLDKFAGSIPSFLEHYNLEGIDFDWEFDRMNPADLGMTIDYATHLFKRQRESLGDDKIMTITPDGDMAKIDGEVPKENLQSLDIEKVNDLFNAVIVQSYGYSRIKCEKYVDNYLDAGFKKSILFC